MRRRIFLEMFLIAGLGLVTIPAASGVNTGQMSSTTKVVQQSEARAATASVLIRRSIEPHPLPMQGRGYDRRRARWEQRVDRRMEQEDSSDGDDEESNNNQAKNKGNTDDDDDEDDDSVDQPSRSQYDVVEQRREYLRNRLERQ